MPSILDEVSLIKKRLKKVETIVTNDNGMISIEKRNDDGSFVITQKDNKKKKEGFVIDLKPDLEISKVSKNIFLGSQDVASSLNILNDNNITHIINVSIDVPDFFPNHFTYLSLRIYDRDDTILDDYITTVNNFIDKAILKDNNSKIFVHCNAGISRSVSVIIAYFMTSCGLSFNEAYHKVKCVRKTAKPNEGFIRQLKCLEKKMCINL
uniref:Protein-tyrosine-phosphatase n=1 Tax=Parastrongyloides trichosuri TaxID=131310 RepID=A0A0N4ZFC5_PARTI